MSIRIIELAAKTNEKYGIEDSEVKELLAYTNELYSVAFQQPDIRPLYNLVQAPLYEQSHRSPKYNSQIRTSTQSSESQSDDSTPSSPINSITNSSPNTNANPVRANNFWQQESDLKMLEIKEAKPESAQPRAAFFPPRDFRKKKTRVTLFDFLNLIVKKQRAKAAPETTELFCRSCGETKTCEWRRGPGSNSSYCTIFDFLSNFFFPLTQIDGYKSLCNACGIHYAKIVKREETQMQSYVPKGPIKMDQLINISTPQDNPSSDAANGTKNPQPRFSPFSNGPIARNTRECMPITFFSLSHF